MNKRRLLALGIFGGSIAVPTYSEKVLAVQPASLLAFWPLNESSGAAAVNAEGTAARNGTYSNVTLGGATGPFGENVGAWNGLTSFVDIYSASLAAAFNLGVFSINIWAKRTALDSSVRTLINLGTSTTNYTSILQVNDSTVKYRILRSGVAKDRDLTSSSSGWNMYTLTYDIGAGADGEMKAYFNAAQVGATVTSILAFFGPLAATRCCIGASDTSATTPFKDSLVYPAVWDVALSQADITTLYDDGPTF